MTSSFHQKLVRAREPRSARRPLPIPRYQSLRRAIEQTRSQITEYQTIVSRLQQKFDGVIRPLEESMTLRVLELTHRLIDRHDQTALSVSDKSVLGLWIGDNIASLSQHPFADAVAAQNLALRWRSSLKAEAGGTSTSNANREPTATHEDDLQRTTGEAEDAPMPQSRPDGGKESQGAFDENSSGSAHSEESSDEELPPEARPSTRDGESVETRTLMAQLFRQLAAVLHPDREPDEDLKQAKDALLSQCLKARQESDLATLLSLHAEHVGGDELFDRTEMTRLVVSLERQLRALQLYLRQLRFGDSLQAMIIERYAGHSDQDTASRFSRHARSLQQEVQRLQQLESSVATSEGLDEALKKRRDELIDRMAINEMTGL